MNIIIIQPPLVQLNSPYPSGAYVSAFFKKVREIQTHAQKPNNNTGFNPAFLEPVDSVHWIDASNLLYNELFCANGLKKLFLATEVKALSIAEEAEKNGDVETAFNVRRYIIQQEKWIDGIDGIQAILCEGTGFPHKSGREFCHEFVRSAHMMRGRRMERFLAETENLTADSARFLATFAIEDLCDYITAVYDPHFEPVRYASSLAESAVSFDGIEQALSAPLMTDFFEPAIERVLTPFVAQNGNYIVCISVPFPGTLAGAMTCARTSKRLFAGRELVLLGGGYVNTELRSLAQRNPDSALFSYVDRLVYDRGYGALLRLLEVIAKKGFDAAKADKTRVLANASVANFIQAEDFFTRSLVPDYSDIDFSRYPRMADDTNSMHRLWSDGAWMKAYLAHGCYWHRCFFCDTTLDYVKNYRMTQTEHLYAGLASQAAQKGVYGVHFVDEAAPPRALTQFALLNCRNTAGRLTFWGNIRFEKAFTRHTADLLAYGGLTGVTGGIEIAASEGLESVCKGIDVESLVAACAAFKEAGILVHAYMIFGYWQETPQMLIDSMETLRQLFVAGLLDCAFWHKFVLTRHSRLYDEWKTGLHPRLRPIEPKNGRSAFAENDMRFIGENESQKYALPLDNALYSWMRREKLHTSVQKWFAFPMPKPSIPPDFIERHCTTYEKKRNTENTACNAYFTKYAATQNEHTALNAKRLYWLGGKAIVINDKNDKTRIFWLYMDEEYSVLSPAKNAREIALALYELRPQAAESSHKETKISYNQIIARLVKAGFQVQNFTGKGLIYT